MKFECEWKFQIIHCLNFLQSHKLTSSILDSVEGVDNLAELDITGFDFHKSFLEEESDTVCVSEPLQEESDSKVNGAPKKQLSKNKLKKRRYMMYKMRRSKPS